MDRQMDRQTDRGTAEKAAASWVPPKTANLACLIRQTLTDNFGRLPRVGQGSKVAGGLGFGKFTCRSASLAYSCWSFIFFSLPLSTDTQH